MGGLVWGSDIMALHPTERQRRLGRAAASAHGQLPPVQCTPMAVSPGWAVTVSWCAAAASHALTACGCASPSMASRPNVSFNDAAGPGKLIDCILGCDFWHWTRRVTRLSCPCNVVSSNMGKFPTPPTFPSAFRTRLPTSHWFAALVLIECC